MYLRKRIKIYVPEDSGQPEEVLILQPASVTPAQHLHNELILSLTGQLCDIKL